MEIRVTIEDRLAGYEIIKDGKTTQWEELTRREQIKVLNAFVNGYELFINALREE